MDVKKLREAANAMRAAGPNWNAMVGNSSEVTAHVVAMGACGIVDALAAGLEALAATEPADDRGGPITMEMFQAAMEDASSVDAETVEWSEAVVASLNRQRGYDVIDDTDLCEPLSIAEAAERARRRGETGRVVVEVTGDETCAASAEIAEQLAAVTRERDKLSARVAEVEHIAGKLQHDVAEARADR